MAALIEWPYCVLEMDVRGIKKPPAITRRAGQPKTPKE